MNDTQLYQMPIEELAARSLVAGRTLADGIPINSLAADARQHGQLRTLLQVFADDQLPVSRARQSLTLLLDILGAEREVETLGHTDVFEGVNDPEYGATGSVYRRRVLSERGEAIEVWWYEMYRIGHMLRILEARLSGERLANRRFAG